MTVLVASAGAPFPGEVLDRVPALASATGPPVLVVSVARIWGSALGLPHPGLYPTRQEMEQQAQIVAAAAAALTARGFTVRTSVLRARNASKAIARYAERCRCEIILISEPASTRWQRLLFGAGPREIRRRTPIAVEAVALRDPSDTAA